MKNFTFYKEDSRWYIDLPEFIAQGGDKAELEMVLGADTLLELYAEGNTSVHIQMDIYPFDFAEVLILQSQKAYELGGGADYILPFFGGIAVDMPVWLCDVTLFVFDTFPAEIYLRKID
ncbi:hypothetical protein LX64_04420 [Chitinophaga skermanii]|uniref:Uncharacterized protein n=1 Tax=Chitinophaga skermanii TaxID=331697 RepID=A0A327QDZ9_9BACT|nr:DUF6717 family protein [Chitinophaga skermanii]RAI99866.1 hypothetical protein LX64_04420 [Chitinophaga skermanii]